MSQKPSRKEIGTEKPFFRVVAGVARRQAHVFLAKRRSDDSLGGFWEFPGGKLEEGETPEAALKREFLEEFGAEVEVGQFLGTNTHEYNHAIIELIGYDVSFVGAISRMSAHECIAWVPLADLKFYDLAPADDFLKQLLVRNQE